MLTRTQKQEQVRELRGRLERASSVFVVDYRGLDVSAQNELRRRLRGEGDGDYEYCVAKNTLLRRAVEGSGAEGLRPHFEGPTAVAFSFGDPVALARILVDYAKAHEIFELKGGLIEGEAVAREQIATLATLPSLTELRGRLAGLILAPATKLARLAVEPGAQLARLVEARRAALGPEADA